MPLSNPDKFVTLPACSVIKRRWTHILAALRFLKKIGHRRFHALGRERHLAYPCAGGIENRVADRRSGECDRRLSRSSRFRCWTVKENNLDSGQMHSDR
jgi:hypothetical protein